jgi:hypothetical protein
VEDKNLRKKKDAADLIREYIPHPPTTDIIINLLVLIIKEMLAA